MYLGPPTGDTKVPPLELKGKSSYHHYITDKYRFFSHILIEKSVYYTIGISDLQNNIAK